MVEEFTWTSRMMKIPGPLWQAGQLNYLNAVWRSSGSVVFAENKKEKGTNLFKINLPPLLILPLSLDGLQAARYVFLPAHAQAASFKPVLKINLRYYP